MYRDFTLLGYSLSTYIFVFLESLKGRAEEGRERKNNQCEREPSIACFLQAPHSGAGDQAYKQGTCP